MGKRTASRIAILGTLMLFGFALVPVALGDKGGAANGGAAGHGGGGNNVTSTATTSTTSPASTSSTTTSPSTTSTKNGKGGGKGSGGGSSQPSSSSLALVSEWVQNSSNPAAPTWCLNEDDFDQRNYSGSLSGSFTTSYQLCDGNVDYSGGLWWTAGGIGLETDVSVVGSLTGLTITAPDGTTHNAVLTGEGTSSGKTTYQYAACYVPPYSISTDQGTDPLAGGTWSITISGQLSQASWITRAQMTDAPFQETYCPVSEQNLTP